MPLNRRGEWGHATSFSAQGMWWRSARRKKVNEVSRFYKYMTSEHWFDSLEKCRLKVSKPSEFYDPFDCTGTCLDDWSKDASAICRNPDEFLEKANNRYWLDERLRVLCLTDAEVCDDASEVLFWSHYAEGGRGVRVCLEINSSNEVFRPTGQFDCVSYSHFKPVFDGGAVKVDEDGKLQLGFAKYLSKCVWTKGSGWAYEHEARAIFDAEKVYKETTDFGNVLEFVRFSSENVKEITFGPLFDIETARGMATRLMLRGYGDSDAFKVAIRDPCRYRYNYDYLFGDNRITVALSDKLKELVVGDVTEQ